MDTITPRPQPAPFDSNRRWYDDYLAAFRLLNQCDSENIKLRQRIHQLETQLQAAQLTPAAIADLGAHEILRCTREHYTLVRALVGELRASRRAPRRSTGTASTVGETMREAHRGVARDAL